MCIEASKLPQSPESAGPLNDQAKHVQFEQLTEGDKEIRIVYQGQIYRLRETRNKRLILTK